MANPYARKNVKGWGGKGTTNETDAQWIARGGHLGTKWAEQDPKEQVEWNASPGAPESAERTFLLAVIGAALEDALYIGQIGKDKCVHCDPYRTPKKGLAPEKRRTNAKCARLWLESRQAKDICEALGLEPDYLRRELAKAKKNARPTRRNSRLSGKAGGKAGSPELGGPIHSGEAA